MAGGRIAGITIEFNGDTTKLKAALKDVDSQVRQSQTQLRDVNKLLKFDPGNTELLMQKYKSLTTSIDGTKSRLDTLREAERQMAENGLQDTDQWDALQREIAETEQKLKSLNQEMDRFGSVGAQKIAAAGEQVQQFGRDMESAGRAIMPASIAAIGFGTVAATKYAEVDKIMTLTNQTMGNTADQAAMLEKAMADAASNSTYGMADHILDGHRQKIISIRYATVKSTHVEFHAEVKYRLATTGGSAVLRVTYQFDNIEWADYHPVETEPDGTHLLHLMFTWRNNGSLMSEFAVYLELDGGEVWIEQDDARAYLTGLGLVGDEAWDGCIRVDQKIIRRDFRSIHGSFTEDVACDTARPQRGGTMQSFARMDFFSLMLKPLADQLTTSHLHRFSVLYSDNDVFKSNITTSGNLWVVEDQNEVGLVITPDCAVTDVLSISSHFTANSGNVSFLVSFDSGDTWYMYASGWHQHESGDGMSGSVMKAIPEEDWAAMITNSTIMVEAILEGEATLEDISITTEVHEQC